MRFRDITPAQLTPGDVIIDHLGENPPVTVLRWAEWDQDRFGRWMMRFWSTSPTAGEGYMTYGPNGFVRIRTTDPALPAASPLTAAERDHAVGWLLDCSYTDAEDCTDEQVVRIIDRHYDGAFEVFLIQSLLADTMDEAKARARAVRGARGGNAVRLTLKLADGTVYTLDLPLMPTTSWKSRLIHHPDLPYGADLVGAEWTYEAIQV